MFGVMIGFIVYIRIGRSVNMKKNLFFLKLVYL